MDEFSKLQSQIRYTFLDMSLLRDALTHPSFGNENIPVARNDDGQFAFLGDAVIGLALADRDVAGGKGEMTKQRADKAKNESLTRLAEKLSLPLLLGAGEKKNVSGESSRLANAVEAVLGGVYLDAGPAHAIRVAKRLLNEGPAVTS